MSQTRSTPFDSGMERPLTVTEMAPHMEGILKLMPDLHITVACWRAQADTVFVEAHNTATIAGQKMLWDAVYCVTLHEGLSFVGDVTMTVHHSSHGCHQRYLLCHRMNRLLIARLNRLPVVKYLHQR